MADDFSTGSGYVRPSGSLDDAPNHGLVDTIFSGQLTLGDAARSLSFSYFTDKCIGQFCHAVGLPLRLGIYRPAFGPHIRQVVEICSEEQMLDLATRRAVAMMTNVQSVRDWAICEFPCQPVGVHAAAVDAEHSVSGRSSGASPVQAFTERHQFSSQTGGGSSVRSSSADAAAKLPAPPSYLCRPFIECLGAMKTLPLHAPDCRRLGSMYGRRF